jgi:hypothetical protein
MIRVARVCACVLLISMRAAAALPADTPPPATKDVHFDHLKEGGDLAFTRNLSDGEKFTVFVDNTCPDVFSYEVHGIMRAAEDTSGAGQKAGKKLESKSLPVVHDAKYGGYIVTITRTAETNPCEGAEKLKSRTLVISTPLLEWDLAFSGGFTVSSLSSPQYYLRPHPTETGKKQVQEDTGAKDAVNLGIASFVHLYHHRWPGLAGVFGLGIRDGNKTEYYLGGGLRFSDKATFNGGLVFGPVSRLPTGVDTTKGVTDDNVLTNLPTRIAKGVFFGISYSFINVRDKLQQPFAGAAGASGAAASAAPKAAACSVTLDKTDVIKLAATKDATEKVKVTGSPATCEWKVVGVPSWVTFDATAGTGEKTLTMTTKEPNGTGVERPPAKIDIGDKTLTITQLKP